MGSYTAHSCPKASVTCLTKGFEEHHINTPSPHHASSVGCCRSVPCKLRGAGCTAGIPPAAVRAHGSSGAPQTLTRRRQDSHLQPPTPSAVLALSEWLILCPHHSPTRCTGSPPSSMNAGHSMLLLILFSPLAHPLVQAAPHTATRQLLTTVDTSSAQPTTISGARLPARCRPAHHRPRLALRRRPRPC